MNPSAASFSMARVFSLNLGLRVLVGGVFVVAGGLKVADPANFALAVDNYRLVPHELVNLTAIFIPWIELTAGAFILAGIWLRAAALVIAGLASVFLIAVLSALLRGLNIECGCFGTVGGHHVGLVSLGLDATLLILATLLMIRSKGAGQVAG